MGTGAVRWISVSLTVLVVIVARFLFSCKFHSLHPKVDPPREPSIVWYIPKSVLLSRQFFGAVVDVWNDSKVVKTQLVRNDVMNAFPSRDPVVLQLLRLMKKRGINDLYLWSPYEDLPTLLWATSSLLFFKCHHLEYEQGKSPIIWWWIKMKHDYMLFKQPGTPLLNNKAKSVSFLWLTKVTQQMWKVCVIFWLDVLLKSGFYV